MWSSARAKAGDGARPVFGFGDVSPRPHRRRVPVCRAARGARMRSSDATLNSKAAAGSLCDWCGETCDPDVAELNALTCTFAECPPEASVYHQDCVEKYLKSVKLDKCVGPPASRRVARAAIERETRDLASLFRRTPSDAHPRAFPARVLTSTFPPRPPQHRSRKAGYRCPRGCCKKSMFDKPCPGTVRAPFSRPTTPSRARIHPFPERRRRPPPSTPPPLSDAADRSPSSLRRLRPHRRTASRSPPSPSLPAVPSSGGKVPPDHPQESGQQETPQGARRGRGTPLRAALRSRGEGGAKSRRGSGEERARGETGEGSRREKRGGT